MAVKTDKGDLTALTLWQGSLDTLGNGLLDPLGYDGVLWVGGVRLADTGWGRGGV